MIKKIITITLAFVFIFSTLSSCTEVTSEDTAPETTEELYVAPVLCKRSGL